MKTYAFEVYETRHKTVAVQAESLEEAEDKIDAMLCDIDMDDAFPLWYNRRWEHIFRLVKED